MLRRFAFVMMILSWLVASAMAQETPPLVRDAALDAAEAALGVRAVNWTFEVLEPTTDSSLGCPIVAGEEMALEVTPYRMSIIYDDGIYVVHVSTDGRMVVLCDEKFGAALETTPEPDPNACTIVAAGSPVYAAPDNLVAGVFNAVGGASYEPFARTADLSWLQITDGEGNVGWIEATSVTASGTCDALPVTAFVAPDEATSCFISPLGAFSNVRNQPSIDSAQVAQIFENSVFQVIAQTSDGGWLFIQPGWVSRTVTNVIGDCGSVTVDAERIGTGFASDTVGASDLDENAAIALAQYPCPADFAGYLPPNISIGFETAAVEVGGIPNALRSFPDVDDNIGARIGVVQPGRVIDRVITGPVCNQGFVWWLVEFDGQTGWTAESNVATGDYFLEARGAGADSGAVPDTETTLPETDTTPVDDAIAVFQQGELPIIDLEIDGSRNSTLYVASEAQGFGDGVNGLVQAWNLLDEVVTASIDVPGGLADIEYEVGAPPLGLAIGASDGRVTVSVEAELETTISDVYDAASASAGFEWDGVTVIGTQCANEACDTSDISMFNAETGELTGSMGTSGHLVKAMDFAFGVLITAGDDGVYRWDIASGMPATPYINPDGLPINDVVINEGGTQALFVGCGAGSAENCTEGRIGLIELASMSLLGIVNSHDSAITEVVFSPDSSRFATTNGNEVIVRNSATGIEMMRFSVPDTQITALAYIAATPNEWLAVGTADGRVLIYLAFDPTAAN